MLRTRLTTLFGISHPIVSAPMAGVAGGALAAAVSEAGGLGLIGGTCPEGPVWLKQQIRIATERTDRPIGVGFISSFPGVEELLAAAIELGVSAVSHSFADPAPYVERAHDAGVKVLAQVQTVEQARAAAAAGVDVITAQGTEAGGHTGYSGTLALVPAVLEAAQGIPVIASGGIADGRGLAAVLMLGAEGAWVGTRLVASNESLAPEWAKRKILGASADDTVLTRAYDLAVQARFPEGIGDRVLRNNYTARWHGRDDEVRARHTELAADIAEASRAADARRAPIRAGVVAGLVRRVEPAGEIVRRIAAEAEQIMRSRPSALLA
jgi:nitronate monooxygenase